MEVDEEVMRNWVDEAPGGGLLLDERVRYL